MGVDFVAMFGHRLTSSEALALPARFNCSSTLRNAKDELEKILAPRWIAHEPEDWAWHEDVAAPPKGQSWWETNRTPCLSGAGFSLHIGSHLIMARHIEKISGFIDDAYGLQGALRGVCREIAREVSSDRAVYLPDSLYEVSRAIDWVYEAIPIEQFESRLNQEFGQAADSIGRMKTENPNGYDLCGYFIDRFSTPRS